MKIPTEHQEHLAFLRWLKLAYPLLFPLCVHYPIGELRDERIGAKLKRMGAKEGFPDFMILIPSKGKHGLFIELKRTIKGKVTPAQTAWIKKLNELGYRAEFAFGWVAAKEIFEDYLS